VTTENHDDAQLVSHAIFEHDPAAAHVFERLRREDPVHRTVVPGFPALWAITKHADVCEVGRNNEIFLSAPMLFLRSDEEERITRAENQGGDYIRSLIHMDEPDHRAYRGVTQGWFMPANLRKMEDTINRLAVEMVDRMENLGSSCDFMNDIAVWLPLRVIMSLLGVPDADHPHLLKLTQEIVAPHDPEMRRDATGQTASARALVFQDFYGFFRDLVARRRARPTDDLASIIANMQVNGKPAPELETLSYLVLLATAGHDTTSSSLAGGILELARRPDQLQALKADPALVNTASEEFFRWVTPVKHFMRTAASDYTLRGRHVSAGDLLMLSYASANRDEEMFDSPMEFRVDRSPNRHVAFGFGAHACLGQNLARMEIRAFLKEFLRRVKRIELAGDCRNVLSNRVSGPKTLPLRFEMA